MAETRFIRENSIVQLTIDYGAGDKEEMRVKIVTEASYREDEVSISSPIGKAVFRQKEGDHLKCELPNGKIAWITVGKIEI